MNSVIRVWLGKRLISEHWLNPKTDTYEPHLDIFKWSTAKMYRIEHTEDVRPEPVSAVSV